MIWFEESKGAITKVPIQADGSYKTPAMKAGSYTITIVISDGGAKSATLDATASLGGNTDLSASGGKLKKYKEGEWDISDMVLNSNIGSPRMAATGQASGKRQHKSLTFPMSQTERLLPTVNKKLGSIVLDEDCDDGITGNLTYKNDSGQAIRPGYNVKAMTK